MLVTEDNIVSMFKNRVKQFPNNIAYKYKVKKEWKEITYQELGEKVENFALGLLELGLKKGDHTGILSENSVEWVILDLGSMTIGCIDIPMYATLTAPQIQYILKHGEVKLVGVQNKEQLEKVLSIRNDLPDLKFIVVFDESCKIEGENIYHIEKVIDLGKDLKAKDPEKAKALLDIKINTEDIATIVYTSGTTKDPKGVMLTHRSLINNARISEEFEFEQGNEISLNYLPFAHIYGRSVEYYGIMSTGSTIAFTESHLAIPRNLMTIKPTRFLSVPALLERVYNKVKSQIDSGSPAKKAIFNWAISVGRQYMNTSNPGVFLRLKYVLAYILVFRKIVEKFGGRIKHIYVGGASMSKEILEFFWSLGLKVFEGYGLTESGPLVAANTEKEWKVGTVGKPTPRMEVKIAQDGEILAKGPNLMEGYWKNEEETKEAIDEEGYLHTGDIGYLDKDGFLVITDRKKEIFVLTSGKNVPPQPLENALKNNKFILQAVVIGNDKEYITALIVPNFEALEEEAKKRGISYQDKADLITKNEVIELYKEIIAEQLKNFAEFERVKKFHLLPNELTQAKDELTPTLKLKRRNIYNNYKKEIEAMYQTGGSRSSL